MLLMYRKYKIQNIRYTLTSEVRIQLQQQQYDNIVYKHYDVQLLYSFLNEEFYKTRFSNTLVLISIWLSNYKQLN